VGVLYYAVVYTISFRNLFLVCR